MIKEYIMQVTVDDDGHEYGLTRKEELIRCMECQYHYIEPVLFDNYLNDRIKHLCVRTQEEIPTNDFFCGFGERRNGDAAK